MVDIDTKSLCLFIPVLSLSIPELSPALEQTFRFSSKDVMVSERPISKPQEEILKLHPIKEYYLQE